MRNDDRLRVLEAGDVLEVTGRLREASDTPITPLTASTPYGTSTRNAGYASSAPPAPTMHFALLLALTWLCGPAAQLLTPAGRRARGWLTLGLAATAAALTILLVPYARFIPLTGPATSLAWGSLVALATIGGFTAWARAVQLTAAALPPPHRLPRLLRSRPAVCMLGLVAPGFGLLVSGRRRHAALSLWLLWPAALGVAVLANAPAMWRELIRTASNSAAADLLEFSFIVASIAVTAGALVWIVQALDGARRLAPAPALSRGHGDWFAVALGVSCAALAVGGNPGRAARQLGDASLVLQAEGLSVIPLQLSLAADRLDRSCTEYAVQAIALHEARGKPERAAALRARLDDGLASYVALLGADPARRDTGPSPAARSADPARAGGSEVYYGTLARPVRAAGR